MVKIRTKKKLGQHFLNNEEISKKIVSSHVNRKNLLEIGPGIGALTKYLIKETNTFLVIEIDDDCVDYLKKEFDNINLIKEDILKVDFENLFNDKFSVISNLPYNISSQVFFKILDNRNLVNEFSFLIQKEVGKRICSKSGNKTYGILSVLLQTYFDLEYLFEVNPDEFNPPPKVYSSVIRGVRNKRDDSSFSYKSLKKIVKLSFQNRRKTLRNSLKTLNLPKTFTSNSIFSKRAEQLDVEDFIWLSNEIKKNEP